jgi:hypothetical protein
MVAEVGGVVVVIGRAMKAPGPTLTAPSRKRFSTKNDVFVIIPGCGNGERKTLWYIGEGASTLPYILAKSCESIGCTTPNPRS